MSTLMTVHTGRLWRRPPPTFEFGTPGSDDPVYLSEFRCRLSPTGGYEQTDQRTGAKPQTRNAIIFVPYTPSFTFERGDEISVDQFPGRRWEIEFNSLIWASADPHHWELSAVQIEGN